MVGPGPVSRPLTAVGTLGRYEVIRHLADGGMAEVLLGRTSGIEGFERYVVIKRIRWDQSRDEHFVKMFLDEARLAASLHHNNILQVHDIGEEAGEYFFTMEYLHGQDLRKVLKRAVAREEMVPLEHVLTIVMNAASGLHFAHEHRGQDRQPLGIVHRDVSLSNIMVGYDGFVKVTDFGIAKAALRSAETRSGVLKGKVAYMSPEQCLGRPVDRRSDVYALGIVLYELATTRRLFKADSDFLTMSAIVDGNIPSPSMIRAEIGPELEAIVMRALARHPSDRYQTADELRAALEDLAVRAQMRTSISALGSYMKQLFGEQPQPWLSDAPVDEPDDSDFDGSASGLVSPPTDASRDLALPQDIADPRSPILRARTRAVTASPPVGSVQVEGLSTKPTDAPPTRRRWRWLAAAAGAVAAIVIAAVVVSRGRETEHETMVPSASVTPPTPVTSVPGTPPTAAAAPPAPAPSVPPPAPSLADPPVPPTETRTATPPPSTGSGSASDAGSAVQAGRAKQRPSPTRPAPPKPKAKDRPKYDPDELLPK